MTEEKIFENMAEIDEKFIVEAHETKNKAPKNTWISWTAVAACLCVAIGIIFLVKYLDKPTIAYADTFDSGELMNYTHGMKVTMGESLLDISDNQLVRVAISLHECYDVYPEYGFSWSNDAITWDDFLDYESYIRKQEILFIKELGGSDFAETERNLIVCTIKKSALAKLSEGKCVYSVVMFTANDTDIKIRPIESLEGEYKGLGCVAVPMISSYGCPVGYGRNADLKISNGRVLIDFQCPDGFPSNFYKIHREDLEAVKVDNSELSSWLDPFYSFGANPELDELRYSTRETYDLTAPDGTVYCHLYVTPTSLYLDLGLWGIYKFR